MFRESLAVACLALTLIAAGAARAQDDATVVRTEYGPVAGAAGDGVIVFRGIPYAKPPVGDLRWRAPQPPDPWTEVKAARALASDCMQQMAKFEPIATTCSEDCLFLNVWRPAGAATNLPVLVWIHGGGFVGGGSSIPYYDGSAFARQEIVVVSFNYRLSRIGFFAHQALIAAKEGAVGNFGYMDQVAALQWVQRNIARFRGDPQRVTIIGESAGGASVLTMITSLMAEGLFSQAMVMSGGGREPLVTRPMTGGPEAADQADVRFAADSLGINGVGAEALAALRARTAQDLVRRHDLDAVVKEGLRCVTTQLESNTPDPACTPIHTGTPMIDGTIVPGTPEEVLGAGKGTSVPIIIGTTAADAPEFFPPSVSDPYSYFGADARAARSHYKLPMAASAFLSVSGKGNLKKVAPVLSIGADMTMHEPARFVARQMLARKRRAWLYRFTYTAESTRPKSKKQTQAGELPFLFQTLDARYGDSTTAKDREMARVFNTYVANFVKTGDPNGAGLAAWPPFNPSRFELMDFTLDGPKYGEDPRAKGIELVERAADTRVGLQRGRSTGR